MTMKRLVVWIQKTSVAGFFLLGAVPSAEETCTPPSHTMFMAVLSCLGGIWPCAYIAGPALSSYSDIVDCPGLSWIVNVFLGCVFSLSGRGHRQMTDMLADCGYLK